MGHRAIAILIEGRTVEARKDHWAGARMLDLVLDGGPGSAREAVSEMEEVGDLAKPYWWDAGVLIDFRRNRVRWFGDPTTTYIGEEEGDAAPDPEAWRLSVESRWRGFDLKEVGGAEAFEAYLTEHHLKLPRVVRDRDLAPIESEDGGEERRERLRAEEERCAPLSTEPKVESKPKKGSKAGCVVTALLLAVFLVPSLLARLVLIPFRAGIRSRLERSARERRADEISARRAELARADARIAEAPDDEEAKVARALLLPAAASEMELDACVGRLESTGGPSPRILAIAIYNRGIRRHQLGLPRLGAADVDRARQLGFEPVIQRNPFGSSVRNFFGVGILAFLSVAGLDPDDDD